MSKAGSKYSYPRCRTPLNMMDNTRSEIALSSSLNAHLCLILKHTLPLLRISNSLSSWNDSLIFVPLSLYIKLGIIKKFTQRFDLVVLELAHKHNIFDSEGSEYRYLLASCLTSIAARRERYYSGALRGIPCENFMTNMDKFSGRFFDVQLENGMTVLDQLPKPV